MKKAAAVNIALTLASIAAALPGARVFYEDEALNSEVVTGIDPDGGAHLARIDAHRANRDPAINAQLPARFMIDGVVPGNVEGDNNVERSCNEANFYLSIGGNTNTRDTHWWPAAQYQGNTRVAVINGCAALAGQNLGVRGVGIDAVFDIYKAYEADVIQRLKNAGKIDFSPPLNAAN